MQRPQAAITSSDYNECGSYELRDALLQDVQEVYDRVGLQKPVEQLRIHTLNGVRNQTIRLICSPASVWREVTTSMVF